MGEFFDALTKLHGKPEPLWETTAVLVYEVGRMMEHAMYLKWHNEPARLGFYKSEVMDAIAQLVLICESLDISFEDMKEMGIEKAMERFEGKEKKLVLQLDNRPSSEEIRLQIIHTLYGGMAVTELLEWLKEKLLVK